MGETGAPLANHVPDDGEVSAEDASKGLEDGVCTKWDVVPREVGASMTEDDGETQRRNDTSPMDPICQCDCSRRVWNWTYARPMQKITLSISFFLVCSCKCQIIGTGIRKIHISVIKLEMFVK